MNPPKHLPGWLIVGIYSLVLALLGWLIIHFDLPDSLLFIFWVPCMLVPFFYRRRVYVSMIAILVIGSVLVTAQVSRSFETSLVTIAVATCSGLIIAEMLRALTRARERTEQTLKESEQRFRASEEQYRLLAETTRDIILLHDMQGRITYINQAGLHFGGYNRGEMLGQPITAFVPTERVAEIAARQRQRAAGDETVFLYETEFVNRAGQRLPVEVSSMPILRAGQADSILIVARDITARKQAEETLARYREHLEEQVLARTAELQTHYAQLDAILRSVGDAIFMTDAQQCILYVNPAFTTLTGYPANEVLGQNVYTLAALAELAPRLPEIIPTLTLGNLWQGDARARRKDGRHYDAALTIAPVYDDAGQLTGHVFTHRDISQAKDLEHARAQFITSVSHQFRSSLTPLKAGIYLLQHAPLADRHRRQLHLMEVAINGFTQLLEDIEQMLILDSGKGVKAWELVSLPGIVAEVAEGYQDQAQAAGLTLKVAPLPALPPVRGDAEHLKQALGELVENAVIFTPAGGQINITVQVSSIGEETWVTIAVQDTGPGLTDEELPRVFERFFRGHLTESKHIPGIGLGLSIAQEIAEAHGGRITVDSTVGQGSTFTLWIRATVLQDDM